MKIRIATFAAAGALAAIAVPAMAQTASEVPFSGVRVGGEVGWDHIRSGSSEDIDDARDLKQSMDGVQYGAVVGYDFPVGENLRIGAEASYSGSTAGEDFNNDDPLVFNLGRVQADRDIYVGGRVGYVTSPSTMVYAKAGYTNQRFSVEGSNNTVNLDEGLDTDGWRVGAGAEFAVGRNAYIGTEYRYSKYSKGEFDFDGNTPDGSRFNLDTDRHQVVATAGIRF
ncbi:outer membrane beta-barrel protein [Altererythrobacter aerius]|uniref:Outer membrane beta-barrel protein n=1 Tax=Tsuneonella aeria TaxID=1837929 RepID=A0A6I4T9J5_9SPHN|nr:porin family protein [Tsuneonella aeria]MXO73852.1 outer membrane beta-barrel protein [Tsuneonella aeria]